MVPFFPLRKIKRHGRYLFGLALLVVVGVAAYLEYVATNTWNNVGKFKQLCYKSTRTEQRVISPVPFLPFLCIVSLSEAGFL